MSEPTFVPCLVEVLAQCPGALHAEQSETTFVKDPAVALSRR